MAAKSKRPTPDKGFSRKQLKIIAEERRKIAAANNSRASVLEAQIRLTEEGIDPRFLKELVLSGER